MAHAARSVASRNAHKIGRTKIQLKIRSRRLAEAMLDWREVRTMPLRWGSGSLARASGFHAGCGRKKNQGHPGGLLRAVSVPLTPGAVAKVSVVVALSGSHAGMVHNQALQLIPVDLCNRISHR